MIVFILILIFVVLAITSVTCKSQPCDRGCTVCRENKGCAKCQNGYFLYRTGTVFRCSECPDNCATCQSVNFATEPVSCYSCKGGYYLHLQNNTYQCFKCPETCKTCNSYALKTEILTCETCIGGFYLHSHNNTDICTCKDGYYLSDNKCKGCLSGRWGHECKFSCIPCTECVSDVCSRDCVTKSGTTNCGHPQSTCYHKCSNGFIGQRRSVISTTNTVPTTIVHQSTERIITQLTTMQRQHTTTLLTTTQRQHTITQLTTTQRQHTISQLTTMILTEPLQTPTSYKTTSISEDGTTLKAKAQTNGSGSPMLYIVIAVLAGLVLTGVIVVIIVCIKLRKQTGRRDQESSPHNSNNKAESLKFTDNARENINISNHENAINVAESDTGYLDMNTIDNVGTVNIAESDTGFVNMNTIDTIASINVVASHRECST